MIMIATFPWTLFRWSGSWENMLYVPDYHLRGILRTVKYTQPDSHSQSTWISTQRVSHSMYIWKSHLLKTFTRLNTSILSTTGNMRLQHNHQRLRNYSFTLFKRRYNSTIFISQFLFNNIHKWRCLMVMDFYYRWRSDLRRNTSIFFHLHRSGLRYRLNETTTRVNLEERVDHGTVTVSLLRTSYGNPWRLPILKTARACTATSSSWARAYKTGCSFMKIKDQTQTMIAGISSRIFDTLWATLRSERSGLDSRMCT